MSLERGVEVRKSLNRLVVKHEGLSHFQWGFRFFVERRLKHRSFGVGKTLSVFVCLDTYMATTLIHAEAFAYA